MNAESLDMSRICRVLKPSTAVLLFTDGTDDDAVALKEVAGVEILESEGEGDGEGWRECGGDHGTPGMRL